MKPGAWDAFSSPSTSSPLGCASKKNPASSMRGRTTTSPPMVPEIWACAAVSARPVATAYAARAPQSVVAIVFANRGELGMGEPPLGVGPGTLRGTASGLPPGRRPPMPEKRAATPGAPAVPGDVSPGTRRVTAHECPRPKAEARGPFGVSAPLDALGVRYAATGGLPPFVNRSARTIGARPGDERAQARA